MAKLKSIIKQLSKQDYEILYSNLMESGADKSALLLQMMYQEKSSDSKIMKDLGVNSNAYYTLRSRLNQKIEEYLLEQVENPRADLLKKVANIPEIFFTKKRTIVIATLKKLEKELLDYDLSNELTVVYKSLKRLHTHTPEYFTYSQLYNKHIAYMLSVDKVESLISDYFRKYGSYLFSSNETEKLEITLINKELISVKNLYDSHRLYVYQSCVGIFHRLFVEENESMDEEPIENILARVQQIFDMYQMDTIYHHLKIVFEYLKLEYYNRYKVYRKAEDYFDEVNDSVSALMSNYTLHTYPARFLFTKLERSLRLGIQHELYTENGMLFQEFEIDMDDVPNYVSYVAYRALSCYYAEKYEEASKWINNLLNEVSVKKYPYALLEIKIILAIQYAIMEDNDLLNQLLGSIQRQIRLLGKQNCLYAAVFVKVIKLMSSQGKSEKPDKGKALLEKALAFKRTGFAPTSYIRIDEKFFKIK
ncbi:hypothetical protein AD998_10395 [bacterium 336/3]|jgi:hypothetical protein|nr:hypothetical protein AD998_10395 [bacterium 336/3]